MTDRESLVDAIAYALTLCRPHFRTMARSHNTDEARQAVAETIADYLERANLEIRRGRRRRGERPARNAAW